MKKTFIYIGAFILGLFSIQTGFYLVPVYQLPLSHHMIFGPLSVFLAYFIFGLPPLTVYFRWILKDSWRSAVLKGGVMVLANVVVLGIFTYTIMQAFVWK